jgi:hypothetical protein
MRTVSGMVGINLKQSKAAYRVSAVVLLLAIANMIAIGIIYGWDKPDNESLALSNYLYILPLLMAILIPALNFGKLMNLGGKRVDFFKSSILTYLYVVVAIVAISMVLQLVFGNTGAFGQFSLFDVFGFMQNGAVVAFFQMSAFLLLFCCVLHTLTLAQTRWYGWVADIFIIAIISVFTPIAPLREALVWFFDMIIFQDSAIVQILSCVVLSALVYGASLFPIKTRQI